MRDRAGAMLGAKVLTAVGVFFLSARAAGAECLGQGCYDGLIKILLLFLAGVIAIIAVATWWGARNWGWKGATAMFIGSVLFLALIVAGIFGQA